MQQDQSLNQSLALSTVKKGIALNVFLAASKFAAGILGHSAALVSECSRFGVGYFQQPYCYGRHKNISQSLRYGTSVRARTHGMCCLHHHVGAFGTGRCRHRLCRNTKNTALFRRRRTGRAGRHNACRCSPCHYKQGRHVLVHPQRSKKNKQRRAFGRRPASPK